MWTFDKMLKHINMDSDAIGKELKRARGFGLKGLKSLVRAYNSIASGVEPVKVSGYLVNSEKKIMLIIE